MKKGRIFALLTLFVVIGFVSFFVYRLQEHSQTLQVGYELDDYWVHVKNPETQFEQGKPLFMVVRYEEPLPHNTGQESRLVVTKQGSDQILQEESWEEVKALSGHKFALTNQDWEKGDYTLRFLRGEQVVAEKVITIE